jgi:hypothetical protein
MKRLVDGIPGRKEKQALNKALQECEEKLTRCKSKKEKNDKLIDAFNKAQHNAREVKKKIAEHSKYLIDIIQRQTVKLCFEVDEAIKENSAHISTREGCSQTLSSVIKLTDKSKYNL